MRVLNKIFGRINMLTLLDDALLSLIAGYSNVIYGTGQIRLLGRRGDDLIYASEGLSRQYIYASNGNDLIIGSSTGRDYMYGGYGNDILVSGGGNDYLRGDHGYDIAVMPGKVLDYTLQKLSSLSWNVTNNATGDVSRTISIEEIRFERLDGYSIRLSPVVNNAPYAEDVTLTTPEDTGTEFDLNTVVWDLENALSFTGQFLIVQGGSVSITPAGQFSFSPLTNYSGVDTVTYTVTDGTNLVTRTVTINTIAVADIPGLILTPQTVVAMPFNEFKIDFKSRLQDRDGSETLTLHFGNLPSGATLFAPDGSEITDRMLVLGNSGILHDETLTLRFTDNLDYLFNFTIRAESVEFSNGSAASVDEIARVQVAGAVAPNLVLNDTADEKFHKINFQVESSLIDTAGTPNLKDDNSETLILSFSGIPANSGILLVDGSGKDISAGIDLGALVGDSIIPIQLQALATDDIAFTFEVTATSTETFNGDTASTSRSADIIITDVQPPFLSLVNTGSNVFHEVNFDIGIELTDQDGSESVRLSFSGFSDIPGISLVVDDGSGDDISDGITLGTFTGKRTLPIQLLASETHDVGFTFQVTATSTESFNGATASISRSEDIIITDVQAPILSLSDTGSDVINEVNFDIGVELTDQDGSESVSLSFPGIPAGENIQVLDAQGVDITNGVNLGDFVGNQIHPITLAFPDTLDIKFTFTVQATALESFNGETAAVSETIGVEVAGAEAPNVTISNIRSGDGDNVTQIKFDIESSLNDTDSESLRLYFQGLPDNATLLDENGNALGDEIVLGIANEEHITTVILQLEDKDSNYDFQLTVVAESKEKFNDDIATQTAVLDVLYEVSVDKQSGASITNDLNLWDSGTALFTFEDSRFLGIDEKNNGTFELFGDTAEIKYTTDVKFGLQSDLNISSGDLDTSIGYDVTISTFYNKTTDTLEIGTSGGFDEDAVSFTTQSPTFSYSLDLIAEFAIQNVKLIILPDDDVLEVTFKLFDDIGISESINLFEIASGDLSKIVTLLPSVATLTVSVPEVNTDSSADTTAPYTASGEDNVLTLTIDLDQAIANLALGGINPVSVSKTIGTGDLKLIVGFEILDVDAVASIDFVQDFTLETKSIDGVFSFEDTATQNFSVGDSVIFQDASSLDDDGDGVIDIATVLDFDTEFSNETVLDFDIDIIFTLLRGTFKLTLFDEVVADATITVFSKTVPIEILDEDGEDVTFIPIFDNTFDLDTSTVDFAFMV